MTAKNILVELEKTVFAEKIRSDWPKHKPYKKISNTLRNREIKVGDVVNLVGGYWALEAWLAKGDVKKIRAARDTPARRRHSQNVKLGLQVAKNQGRRLGRKPKLSPEDIAKAEQMFSEGKSARQIATALGVTHTTIYWHFSYMKKKRKQRLVNEPN